MSRARAPRRPPRGPLSIPETATRAAGLGHRRPGPPSHGEGGPGARRPARARPGRLSPVPLLSMVQL